LIARFLLARSTDLDDIRLGPRVWHTIRHDYSVVLRPKIRLYAFPVLSPTVVDVRSGAVPAHKRDCADCWVIANVVHHVCGSMDDIYDARRKARALAQFSYHHRCTRITFGGLNDQSVPCDNILAS
jgi:hypothetical protein